MECQPIWCQWITPWRAEKMKRCRYVKRLSTWCEVRCRHTSRSRATIPWRKWWTRTWRYGTSRTRRTAARYDSATNALKNNAALAWACGGPRRSDNRRPTLIKPTSNQVAALCWAYFAPRRRRLRTREPWPSSQKWPSSRRYRPRAGTSRNRSWSCRVNSSAVPPSTTPDGITRRPPAIQTISINMSIKV